MCNKDFVTRTRYLIEGPFKTNNISADFYNKIKEFYEPEWFMNQTASWNSIFKPVFTESLTRRGYGFTFNMLTESKLLTNM
jgi:hypothetical protein